MARQAQCAGGALSRPRRAAGDTALPRGPGEAGPYVSRSLVTSLATGSVPQNTAPRESKHATMPEVSSDLAGGPRTRLRHPLPGLMGAIGVGAVVMGAAFTLLRPPPPKFTPLLWVPAICGRTDPGVGYGSCAEVRGVLWLQGQMNVLRAAGVRGFADLPAEMPLEFANSGDRENLLLYVRIGRQRLAVGVGYELETNSQDGCLHLYHPLGAPRSAKACVDTDGQWWAQDEHGGSYRRVAR